MNLKKIKSYKKRKGPVVLIILDGVGIGKETDANAVYKANTPFLDSLKNYQHYTQLKAHGTAVGMPSDNDMGNSEVGHNALGSGQIVDQGSSLVKKAIESKQLFKNETWKKGLNYCKNQNGTLHFIGLLSDGNVHNHIDYQIKLLEHAEKENIKKIRLHILLDGRDVYERSALSYLKTLNQTITLLQSKGVDIKIASGGGRMVTTMDRYNADWNIVKRGWDAHVLGKAKAFDSAEEAITYYYDSDPNMNDQYIPPFVITENKQPIGPIIDGDTVFFTNFRGDRAIELSKAFENDTFTYFNREKKPSIYFAGMMQYDGDENIPNNFLIPPPEIERPLSYFLCAENVRSFAISETQKYGHVTYFWNGNKSGYINQDIEKYIEIKSDTIPFDQAPEMKAHEITKEAIELINSNQYQFGRINYPNGDMVGHTGNLKATISTMETVDKCTKKCVDAILKQNGIAIILADHGNADEMYTQKNGIKKSKTSHTLNPVPFTILDAQFNDDYTLNTNLKTPGLANVAATICNLLGFESPKHFEPSLINFT